MQELKLSLNIGLYVGNDNTNRNTLVETEAVLIDALGSQGLTYGCNLTIRAEDKQGNPCEPTAIFEGRVQAEHLTVEKVRLAVAVAAARLGQEAIAFKLGYKGYMVYTTTEARKNWGEFQEDLFLTIE